MKQEATKKYLARIQQLEEQLAEAQQIIEVFKAGEVDALAFPKEGMPEIFILKSGDFAYRVLVENLNAGVLNISKEGLIVYTNHYFHNLLNLSYEKVIGNNIASFIHSGSKKVFHELFKKGVSGQSTGEINLKAGKKVIPVHIALTSLYPQLQTVSMLVTDLSEKRAHELTITQRDDLKNLVMQSPVPIIVYEGSQHIVKTANESQLKLWGKTLDEVIGKPFISLEPSATEVVAMFDNVYKTGEPIQLREFPFHYIKNGQPAFEYFTTTISPLRNNKNEITGIIAVGYSVTEQVEARKKVEENEKRFRLLTEGTTIVVWSTNPEGHLIPPQPSWEKYTGQTEEQYKENGWTLMVHPEDREFVKNLWDKAVADKTNYKSWGRLWSAQHNDWRYYESHAFPFLDNHGEVTEWVGIIHDVHEKVMTQKKIEQSEQQLRQVNEQLELSVNAGAIGLWHWDVNQNILSWSKEQLNIYGLSAGEFNGTLENFLQCLHPDELALFYERSQRFNDQDYLEDNFRIIRKDGQTRWIHVRQRAIRNTQNELEFVTGINIDITDQKTAEEKLILSEHRFRTIAEVAPAFVWICSAAGENIFFNERWYQYTGQSYQEASGYGWTSATHPEDWKRIAPYWERCQQTGELYEGETRYLSRNGEWRWFNFRGIPLYNQATGEIESWYGISIDIHDKKLAEEKLKQSRQEYKLLSQQLEQKITERTRELSRQNTFIEHIINTSQEWINVWDKNNNLLMINDACAKAIRKNKRDIIGKNVAEIFPSLVGSKSFNDLHRALQGEIVYNDAYFSAVTNRWIQNYITPLKDEEGNVYAALAIAIDVTDVLKANEELRKSQHHFSQLFNASPVAKSISLVADGTVLDVNPAWERLFEHTRENVVGKTAAEIGFVSQQQREENVKLLSGSKDKIKSLETQYNIGNKIIYTYTSVVEIELNGEDCYLAAYFDITQRKHDELRIQEANSELKKMNEELASFNYISSHDLQEPLRKIQMLTSRIMLSDKENISHEGLQYFSRIVNAANRMQQLIDDLLAYSGTNTSKRIFLPTDVHQIIQQIQQNLREQIEEAKATILVSELPTLSVIPHQFLQLFTNLIANSIKYKKKDVQPVISINAEKIAATEIKTESKITANTYWKISVIDNGIGFDPQFAIKIFELFQRLHSKEEYTGTGIGLAICKKIVENHHGIITAQSELHKGSTFNIYIPENNITAQ